jgi:hypothetical protein
MEYSRASIPSESNEKQEDFAYDSNVAFYSSQEEDVED